LAALANLLAGIFSPFFTPSDLRNAPGFLMASFIKPPFFIPRASRRSSEAASLSALRRATSADLEVSPTVLYGLVFNCLATSSLAALLPAEAAPLLNEVP
jgi:hypothetical protein